MAKTKQISMQKNTSKGRVEGGKTKMHQQAFTGTQTPGQSAQMKSGKGGGSVKGGSTKMFGKQTVKAKQPA